jgi:carbonic anhydrase/acetyltransferase-like protein (isoleucine patch superfamily)
MKAAEALLEKIVHGVTSQLSQKTFDVAPYIQGLISDASQGERYAVCGITSQHPLNMYFEHSILDGSYFLGRCRVKDAMLYKADVRGDELKRQGEAFTHQGAVIDVPADESIQIEASCLVKTLVHNFSHDPKYLDRFPVLNTCALDYANIHGAPTCGSVLGPFSTVDLTTVRDCVIGAYAYVQAGKIAHMTIDPGTLWIESKDRFNFQYRYPAAVLEAYVSHGPRQAPQGILCDFMAAKEHLWGALDQAAPPTTAGEMPDGTSVDQYAILRGQNRFEENVLVSQRAYLEHTHMGKGSNAQENCHVIHSHLAGNNVTAHGAKIIHTRLGHNVFVGFNSFLRGSASCPLTVGAGSIVMPHTIIDLKEPVAIEPETLIWGYIGGQKDLATQSIRIEAFKHSHARLERENMVFEGDGAALVAGLEARITHILEANGAFFDGTGHVGHAQQHRHMAYHTLQPYPEGALGGIYPTIEILP